MAKYVMTITTTNEIEDDRGLEVAIRHFKRADWTDRDIARLKSGEPVEFADHVPWAGNRLKTKAQLMKIEASRG